jgi:hypothetical protein
MKKTITTDEMSALIASTPKGHHLPLTREQIADFFGGQK